MNPTQPSEKQREDLLLVYTSVIKVFLCKRLSALWTVDVKQMERSHGLLLHHALRKPQ